MTVIDVAGHVGPFFTGSDEKILHILVYGISLFEADIYGETSTVDRGLIISSDVKGLHR